MLSSCTNHSKTLPVTTTHVDRYVLIFYNLQIFNYFIMLLKCVKMALVKKHFCFNKML